MAGRYDVATKQEMFSKAAASPREVINKHQQTLTPWLPRSFNRNCINERRIMHGYA